MEAKSAANVLSIVGISQAVLFGIMHYLCSFALAISIVERAIWIDSIEN